LHAIIQKTKAYALVSDDDSAEDSTQEKPSSKGAAPAGFQTPSTAYSIDLVMDIPAVSLKPLN